MTVTATIKTPVCEQPGCGMPILPGQVFYLVPDKIGTGQVICANCWMKLLVFLEEEFSRNRKARDEAKAELRECTAALSRVACANKEIA